MLLVRGCGRSGLQPVARFENPPGFLGRYRVACEAAIARIGAGGANECPIPIAWQDGSVDLVRQTAGRARSARHGGSSRTTRAQAARSGMTSGGSSIRSLLLGPRVFRIVPQSVFLNAMAAGRTRSVLLVASSAGVRMRLPLSARRTRSRRALRFLFFCQLPLVISCLTDRGTVRGTAACVLEHLDSAASRVRLRGKLCLWSSC